MNRLQAELHRLFLLSSDDQRADMPGMARGMVMELAGPADWEELSKVWHGVQEELRLPAPAIAVSGSDGLQLWFSLQSPVNAARAADFLSRLCARYLPGVAQGRVRLQPWSGDECRSVPPVPAQFGTTGNWSAFIAPDLAPIFSDTPWLDVEPGVDGQADLLARVEPMGQAAFDAAMQRLPPVAFKATAPPAWSETGGSPPRGEPAESASDVDPRRFLQQVLNDETAALALRIEAAKALLYR